MLYRLYALLFAQFCYLLYVILFFHCMQQTMIHPIFPSRKPRTDFFIFFLGAVSLVLCFALNEYSIMRPLPASVPERLRAVADSACVASGMSLDSIDVSIAPSADSDVLLALSDTLGIGMERYLDTARVQEILYRCRFYSKRTSGGFRFGGGGEEKRGGASTNTEEEGAALPLSSLWLTSSGEVVGFSKTTIASLSASDSALQTALLHYVPLQYRKHSKDWQKDTTNADESLFRTTLRKDAYIQDESLISAERLGKRGEGGQVRWRVTWEKRVSLHKDIVSNRAANVAKIGGTRVSSIVTMAFWSITVVLVAAMFIAFMVRLRKKAISLGLFITIALLTTAHMVLSIIGMLPTGILILFFIIIVYLVIVGILCIGAPASGLISIAREVFAEKFYTIVRLTRWREKPYLSMYVGRSLLLGLSVGAVYGALMLLVVWGGVRWDIPAFANMRFMPDSFKYSYLMHQWSMAVFSILYSKPMLYMVLISIFTVLAYRFLPVKSAFWVSMLLTCLYLSLFNSMSDYSVLYTVFYGICFGVLGVLVLVRTDVLGILAFSYASAIFAEPSVLLVHPWLLAVVSVLGAAAVIFGVIAYRNAPEVVSESDYKAPFLLQMEEEKRWNQEIAAAKSVQQKLLPRSLPTFDSVVVSAACVPAYEVGGDYYDFFPLDDKRLGVLIGDVSGKGISAAFYITLAKGVIVSQVRGAGSPSDVLHRVNALLYGVMERGKFVSMIYGIYNTHSREFSFANAGHNPLVVRRTDGDIRTISAKGMAIGLDKGERFERAVTTASVTLEKGDCIFLYTDGVTEAMNVEHAEYGEERMIQALQAAPLNAGDIVSAALADVRKFAGKAHQHDDITLVALQAV